MGTEPRMAVEVRHGRPRASAGSPWEPKVGYARAVRAGDWIVVSGTVGLEADGTYAPTAGEQMRRALAIVRAALEAVGGRLEHVIRTRMFVIDIGVWEEIGAVHGEVFGDVRPVTTMVEVRRLIDAEALVEIEVDAVVPAAAATRA